MLAEVPALTITPIEVRVKCQGRWHRIQINDKGEMILLAHSQEEIDRELRFLELGGSPCRCVHLQLLWPGGMVCRGAGRLPQPLRAAAAALVRWKHREVLVLAICAAPGDLRLRLAYADWLDVEGQHEDAQLLRVRDIGVLSLEGAGITDAGAVALAGTDQLLSITTLDLSRNDIGADGAAALAESPYAANLTRLVLADNDIGPEGARALAASRSFTHLEEIDLTHSFLGDVGAEALAASSHLRRVDYLNLAHNGITDAGLRALIGSPLFARLNYIDLSENRIGDAARALLALAPRAKVPELNLRANPLSKKVRAALRERFGDLISL